MYKVYFFVIVTILESCEKTALRNFLSLKSMYFRLVLKKKSKTKQKESKNKRSF